MLSHIVSKWLNLDLSSLQTYRLISLGENLKNLSEQVTLFLYCLQVSWCLIFIHLFLSFFPFSKKANLPSYPSFHLQLAECYAKSRVQRTDCIERNLHISRPGNSNPYGSRVDCIILCLKDKQKTQETITIITLDPIFLSHLILQQQSKFTILKHSPFRGSVPSLFPYFPNSLAITFFSLSLGTFFPSLNMKFLPAFMWSSFPFFSMFSS